MSRYGMGAVNGSGWPAGEQYFPIQDLDGLSGDELVQAFGDKGVLKNCYDFKLYDSLRLQPTALLPASQATFFQVPVGQMKSIFGTAATQYTQSPADTNLVQASQLPKGRFMLVTSIEITCPLVANLATISTSGNNIELNTVQGIGTSTSPSSDARTLLTLGYGFFYLGTRKFQEGQLIAFPTTEGITGYGWGIAPTTGQTAIQVDAVANNGFGCAWKLTEPIGIQQYMNFNFVIQFFNPFTVLALTSQVIKVSLVGKLYDPVM